MAILEKSLEPGLVWLQNKTYNEILKRLTKLETEVITKQKSRLPTWNWVWAVNGTGADIPAYNIVGFDTPTAPTDPAEPGYGTTHTFDAIATSAATDTFGVAMDGIRDNITARIVTTGVATATVDVQDLAHDYAQPSATDGLLESTAVPTNVRILYAPALGANSLCKVLLGSGGGAEPILGRLHCSLPADLALTDDFIDNCPVVRALDGRTYPATVRLENVPSGLRPGEFVHEGESGAIALVTYDIDNDEYWIDGTECSPVEVVIDEMVPLNALVITGPDTGNITLSQTPRNVTAFVNETMGVGIPRDATNGYTLVGNVISWVGWEIKAGDELRITYAV